MTATSHLARSKAARTRRKMIAGVPSERHPDDYYATPTEGVLALLSVEHFVGDIAEPACGMGHISRVLIDHGHDVYSSDLIDRGYGDTGVDFLTETRPSANIITNPPFKLATPFVLKALQLTQASGGKVAMLLKTTFLESEDRTPVLDLARPARIYPFADRLKCLRGNDTLHGIGGGMMSFSWFVWDHQEYGPTTIPCRLRSADFAPKKELAHPHRKRKRDGKVITDLFPMEAT